MSEDRSLEEFTATNGTDDDGDEAESDDGGVENGDINDQDDTDNAGDGIEPATATTTVSSSGAPCERCGAVVERRWLEGNAYVCSDCKEW
ncbi:hypothetical protein ACERIT_09685 [Halopenitus sp. H-Gu1]|uniref:DUF7573 domain-containing protein n=1 Tax=Halopenitus sp. H-Gu1 TaxID=3242697 RepID=UPI00359DD735